MLTRRSVLAATASVAMPQVKLAAIRPDTIRMFWEPLDRQMIEWLNLAETDRVLDAGCGRGDHVRLFAEKCPVVGVDLKTESLSYAQKHVHGGRAEIRKADITKLPFPDASFTLVWSSHVFHGSRKVEKMAAELKRVLKPGGRFVIRENRVMSSLLPADIGFGEPALEARADLAFSTYLAKDRIGLGRVPYLWGEILRQAGMRDVKAHSFLYEINPPFHEIQEEYFRHYLARKAEGNISEEDKQTLRAISNPADPRYVLKRPDLYFVSVSTVYWGVV